MYLTKKYLSRRTVLRGMGATVALPFLEAMVPARTALAKTAAAGRTRLSCIEMVHGAAGSTQFGLAKNLWSPAALGRGFDLSPSSLAPLDPLRDYITIVSNTDCKNAEAFGPKEIGGDHFRSSAVFLTQAHPKQTEGSDIYVGPSMDQLYAQRFGQDTPIPSLQLCIENVDQSGGCAYGYACVYTDTISWASPTQPLPMVRDPRSAFDQLFGVGATPEQRAANRRTDRSILDWVTQEVRRLSKDLGAADRTRLSAYLEDIREIERRIQKVEAYNASGEPRDLGSAVRVRPAVRRRRHPGAARGEPANRSQHPRLGDTGGPPPLEGPRRRRPYASQRVPRRHPRNRAPHSEGRGLQRQRRAARTGIRGPRSTSCSASAPPRSSARRTGEPIAASSTG